MSDFTSIILLLLGIAQLGFGIYLFYIFLPFWYGLFGAMLGVGLSQLFFDQTTWFTQFLSWTMVIGLGIGFAFASYALEPYRRYLLGGLLGATIGLLVAGMFVLAPFWGITFAILGAIGFGVLTYYIFDPMIIIASSVAGAALIMDSLFFLTRGEITTANAILWGLLVIVGIAWQSSSVFRNVRENSINVAGV